MNRNTVFSAKVSRQFDSLASGTAEAVHAINKNLADLTFVLFDKVKHPLKFLSPVCFRALVCAAKIGKDIPVVFPGIFIHCLLLSFKRKIFFCLLFTGNAGVNNIPVRGNEFDVVLALPSEPCKEVCVF
ncbi:MAG: hypothetical protein HYU69_00350 [Bacteroidetes bacterium]|nr:hypothetical protein [Bacteroidota bacterium]